MDYSYPEQWLDGVSKGEMIAAEIRLRIVDGTITPDTLLTENQIAFEEVNIDEQPEAVDWLKAQGFQSVPVITSDAETVIGFRPDQLRKLAS